MRRGADNARLLSESLRIVALEPDRVVLAVNRAAGCAACGARKGCAAQALAKASQGPHLALARPLGVALAVGDDVDVSMSGDAFLAAVGLAYLLPAVALVAAVCVAAAAGVSDMGQAAAGIAALALGFVPLARAEARARRQGRLTGMLTLHPRTDPPRGDA